MVHALTEVRAVRAVRIAVSQSEQLPVIDEPLRIRDFLDAGDLQTLPQFERLHELRRRQQRIVGAAVEPCDTASEPGALQLSPAAGTRD